MKNKIEKQIIKESIQLQQNNIEEIYARLNIPYNKPPIPFYKRPFFAPLIATSACLVLVLSIFSYNLLNATPLSSEAYVSLSINNINQTEAPSIDLLVDKTMKTKSAILLNDTSKIITQNINLYNIQINKATNSILNESAITGFLDKNKSCEDPNYISLLIIAEDNKSKTKLKNEIHTEIISYFKANYIYGKIVDIENQLTQDENIIKKAEELNVSLEKYDLICKVFNAFSSFSSAYTKEYLATLTINELKALLEICLENKEEYYGNDFLEELKLLKAQYSSLTHPILEELESLQNQIFKYQEEIRKEKTCQFDPIDFYHYSKDIDAKLGKINKEDYDVFYAHNFNKPPRNELMRNKKGHGEDKACPIKVTEARNNIKKLIDEQVNPKIESLISYYPSYLKSKQDLEDKYGDEFYKTSADKEKEYKDEYDDLRKHHEENTPPHGDEWEEEYKDYYKDNSKYYM